jgi:hypothetical protein
MKAFSFFKSEGVGIIREQRGSGDMVIDGKVDGIEMRN